MWSGYISVCPAAVHLKTVSLVAVPAVTNAICESPEITDYVPARNTTVTARFFSGLGSQCILPINFTHRFEKIFQ